MRSDLLRALQAKYTGDVLTAKANIRTYIENPAGIGEHPDIVEAVDEQIQKLAEAQERLETVEKLIAEN